jgi:hypothetical protein
VPLLLAVTLLFRRATLHRRTGMALLVLYAAYNVYTLARMSPASPSPPP